DDISADLETGEVSIAENGHTTTTTLSDCESSTMAVKLVSNYTGEGFNATNASKSEVQGEWSAEGEGWGNYVVTISVSTNTGSKPFPLDPGPLSNNEDGEEVNVKMQVIAYELEFEEIESSAE
nr:hypothetical protein [Candidatus Poseidoniales archaeon]